MKMVHQNKTTLSATAAARERIESGDSPRAPTSSTNNQPGVGQMLRPTVG